MADERMALHRSQNAIFVPSAVAFNVLVSAVYLSTKLGLASLQVISGLLFVSLMVPFAVALRGYVKNGAERRIVVSNAVVLLYIALELLLDYVLKIPFRELPAIHVPYIVIFYAAEFSMIGVSFNIDRRSGLAVAITFCVLLGCLAYLYLG